MTARETAFVAEYLATRNATDAARKAGYSARTANNNAKKILERPHVAEAVQAADEALAERSKRGRDEVIADAMAVQEAAKAEGDLTNWCRSLELEAKMRGLLTERRRVEQSGTLTVRWQRPGEAAADGG